MFPSRGGGGQTKHCRPGGCAISCANTLDSSSNYPPHFLNATKNIHFSTPSEKTGSRSFLLTRWCTFSMLAAHGIMFSSHKRFHNRLLHWKCTIKMHIIKAARRHFFSETLIFFYVLLHLAFVSA